LVSFWLSTSKRNQRSRFDAHQFLNALIVALLTFSIHSLLCRAPGWECSGTLAARLEKLGRMLFAGKRMPAYAKRPLWRQRQKR
jgi:hypothetical protein